MFSDDQISSYWQLMKSERMGYEEVWEDITRLMKPWRGTFNSGYSDGAIDFPDQGLDFGLYDTTALRSSQRFVSYLKSQIVPSTSQWLILAPPREREDDDAYRRDLDDTSMRIHDGLDDSNWNVVNGQIIQDLVLFTNSCTAVREGKLRLNPSGSTFGGLVFSAVHIDNVWWRMGSDGKPILIFRRLEMSAFEAGREFEDPGDRARRSLDMNRQLDRVEYLHCVYPSKSKSKPWAARYFALGSSTSSGGLEPVGEEESFEVCPYICSRYQAMDGHTYGRGGPGEIARPDAKTVNRMLEMVYDAASIDLRPPLVVEEDNGPGFQWGEDDTIVLSPTVKRAPSFLNTSARYDVANEIGTQQREQIREVFMEEQIVGSDTQPRSALESQIALERALQQLAVPADTIANEWLSPVVDAVVNLMLRGGELPELERRLKNGEDVRFRPQFISPLFNALRQERVRRTQSLVQSRAMLREQTGDPMYMIDIDPRRVTKFERESAAIPPDIFRTEEEVQQLLEAQAQQMAEQREMQRAQVGAQIARQMPEEALRQ